MPAQPNVFFAQPSVPGFTCNRLFCACTGDDDCNDMFETTLCDERDICIDGKCYCIRKEVAARE